MIAVWNHTLRSKQNITLAFVLSFEKSENFLLKLSAANVFQVFVDGELKGFGPNRTSLDYARVSEYKLSGKRLVIKVHSHFINSYAYMKQSPFFAAIVECKDKIYSSLDFQFFHLNDRVQKVSRYSYQRGFSEVYKHDFDPHQFLISDAPYPQVNVTIVNVPKLLMSSTPYPLLNKHTAEIVQKEIVEIQDKYTQWRPPFVTLVGEKLEGFLLSELESNPLDEVARFVPNKAGQVEATIYKFPRLITGFFVLEVETEGDDVFLLFDELIEKQSERLDVDYKRNMTHNLVKWTLNKGKHHLLTIEPYSAKYVKIIAKRITVISLSIIDFENGEVNKASFNTSDSELNLIFKAAQNTFAQNGVDILMDCPSRERAGWLSDSYFSSVAELYLTGHNKVETAFLENYTLRGPSLLPKGMIPMVYPADDYDQVFIPNWALWYGLEISKYAKIYGKNRLIEQSIPILKDLLAYFAHFENEFSLLENLDSWVFVEWSEANNHERTKGVNIPTNALYFAFLKEVGSLLNEEKNISKADKVKEAITKLAYKEGLFVDNLIRDDKGELKPTTYYSEVCQYYLFWTKTINKEDFNHLYSRVMNDWGPRRIKNESNISAPNMMYGIYMRLDLLMADGKREQLLEECKYFFLPMAEKTLTLWENNNASASCNHGFASYAVRWLVYGLTGYDYVNSSINNYSSLGITGEIILPLPNDKNISFLLDNSKVEAIIYEQ